MPRPFTRDQQLENRAFLRALERSGNIRLAAREIGRSPATMHGRRGICAAFAQRWAAVTVTAQARLVAEGGLRGPEAAAAAGGAAGLAGSAAAAGPALRTAGGESVVVRRNDGKLQVRRAQPGKITRAGEQAFLAALSATCNVRLAAAAVGVAEAAFYRRKRTNPGFAREMRLALALGYDRLELALLESTQVESHGDDGWRHNDPPPVPPMTVPQALQLLFLHQKEARLLDEPAHIRRRPGEGAVVHRMRMIAMSEHRDELEREAYRLGEAERQARDARSPHEPIPAALPALDQVTGWSEADPATADDLAMALFGGWRFDWDGVRRRVRGG